MNSNGYQQVSNKDVEYTSNLKPEVQQVRRNKFSDEHISENIALNDRSHSTYKSTGQSANDVELVEIKLHPNDSLQSISIKFMCPISTLKRVNNIVTDNQAYALNKLKVPVRSHQYHLIEELRRYEYEAEQSDSPHGAGVGSTDNSEDEYGEMERHAYDMRDTYEGEGSLTSIPLLAEESNEISCSPAGNDKKEFEKLMAKNKELIEGIKPSLNRLESLEDLRIELNSSDNRTARRARCGYMQISPLCVTVSSILILIVVPILLVILYMRGDLSLVMPP